MSQTTFHTEGIKDEETLFKLVEYEHSIYPSADEQTIRQVLSSWLLPNNNNSATNLTHRLSSIYYSNTTPRKILGFYIVLPLHEKSYEALLDGRLTELDIRPNEDLVVDATTCDRIGLHVYHVEKFGGERFSSTPFTDLVLGDISAVLKEFPNLNVIGFSGYCVTRAGIDLFFNKWNCREFNNTRSDATEEHIVFDPVRNELQVIECLRSEASTSGILAGLQPQLYKHRCKMLVTRPGEFSIVWRHLPTKLLLFKSNL